MKANNRRLNIVKIIIGLIFMISVVVPLIKMFVSIGNVDIKDILLSKQFIVALKNSLLTTLTATLISVSLSFLLAWSIIRTNIKYKEFFIIFLTLPMLIPSISHGMGLIILFGTNGVLTQLLNLNWSLYGFWGIVIGSVMYSFPLAFLMISDTLKYEDSTPYEAADVLGFSSLDKFRAITLPYIRKPMVAVVFAIFTMIVTDYGVALMIGGKVTTLPVMMYQEVIGRLDFSKGSAIGLVLLVPAFVAFIIDLLNQDRGNTTFTRKEFNINENKLRDILVYILIGIIMVLISLPILVFIILAFTTNYPNNMSITLNNVITTFKMNGDKFLLNSLIISIVVSLVGTVLAYIAGYLTARSSNFISKALHLLTISSLAIPGLVLGLSYVITFNESAIYGTMLILILVNLVHFFASPYLMIYNTFGKINENLEAVGMTLGIGRLRMIKDVFIPQTMSTILEMISYFFVNSMVTISAVSFLANINNKPISLLINEFEGNMMIEASAFVSLIILIINIAMKGIIYLIKRNRVRKGLVE